MCIERKRNLTFSFLSTECVSMTSVLYSLVVIFVYIGDCSSIYKSRESIIKQKKFTFSNTEAQRLIIVFEMDKIKLAICFVGIILPIVIFGSSWVSLKYDKDDFLPKHTRDCAQIMYLVVTVLGVRGHSTDIHYFHGQLTLDMMTVIPLGVSCMLMSLSFFQKTVPVVVLTMFDIVANGAAALYLIVITTPYLQSN